VLVQSAVRDEGTSYHYAAPGRVIDADPAGVAALRETFDAARADYVIGRTWTTDAFYREPSTRIARRVEEGCLVVEMEAAAFIAVARFRGVRLGQLLYAGDSVAGAEWDHRDGSTPPGPACSTSPRPQHCASTPADPRRRFS
jgi:uridine phosphorylase